MNSAEQELIKKASEIREKLGGIIFAFPIRETDPHSPYAVVVYGGGKYFVYPKADDIRWAGLGVVTIMEEMRKQGETIDYERDVRFVSYQAQMNAPDVTMRRLRNSGKYMR
jgi:hypothetical protein